MIFSKQIVKNSRAAADQFNEVARARNAANMSENMFANFGQQAANEGIVPRDVYQEFDRVSVERMRSDDGDTFLNDLLPMSRSISIGKLVHKFRQVSDAGNAQTSMTGQIGTRMDQTEFTYDGSIVPIHDTGFFRNWREMEAQSSEGFDALIDDNRESVATLRRHLADSFLDGHTDKDGNIIVVDGVSWQGMRNDSRVAQVDLGGAGLNFDFTDNAQTGDDIKNAFMQIRDTLWITNKCEIDATYYVSREIASNFERKFAAAYESKQIITELAALMGVKEIKVTSKLSGNELMAFPLNADNLRPIVGMGINTVALPRPVYNSNHEFSVWGAIGWEVRTDYSGNTCALFANE